LRNIKTINEIAQDNTVHPTQVSQWKKDLIDNTGSLFDVKRGPKLTNTQNDPDRLYAKTGQLNMELDWYSRKILSWRLKIKPVSAITSAIAEYPELRTNTQTENKSFRVPSKLKDLLFKGHIRKEYVIST